MSYPTKQIREACWNARDQYWKCLDVNQDDEKPCVALRELFEGKCSAVWVKHFDRKRKYDQFKKEMDDREWAYPKEETS